ncbi:hypothetical protein [Desulforamulus aeronauticus]|uniref:Uncharacterized protein n=1 Tax=Desulforamulus aeronauticus DSM 10349 TaxID=1121421 RepID=A0A1M6NMC0_9FIRM|nr:hypothetical protein [Desulforamulus aeronauticus]SHJ96897.1 hypothetical protein SAMN02745123_00223 [Desulforamulus aeronauticus DSM 10349]
MSEERLARLESLMEDLIKMVGHNNALLVDTRNDVAELKTDVAVLKTDVAELKTDVAELKTDVIVLKTDVKELKRNQELFREELFTQSARIDDNHKEVLSLISEVALNANYAVSMVNKHDKDIFAIKERLSV